MTAGMRFPSAVLVIGIAACSDAEPDPSGDEGNLTFLLGADYGADALLRGTPLAAGDEVVIVAAPLGEEDTRTFVSSDPEVLAVGDVTSVTVCATFTLIGSCDRASTGEIEITVRAGRPGVATLEALRADGSVLDRIEVEVTEVAGFRMGRETPLGYEVDAEPTYGAVPVDADGRAVWLGQSARWDVTPPDRLRITSQHRSDFVQEVRAIGLAPGEGVLTVTGPGGVTTAFEIVVE